MNSMDLYLQDVMPAEQFRKYKEGEEAREAKERALADQLRVECGAATVLIGEAIQRPRVARGDLEDAIKHLNKALSIAAALDPE